MLTVRNSVGALALCMIIIGCGDETQADPSDIFGGSSGSTSNPPASTFCQKYCQSLVDNADGCEHYNDDRRCENICRFYETGACRTTYSAFAECLQTNGGASCITPDAGRITLVVDGCNEEYEAWIQCRDERDAGVCPY